MNNKFYFLFLLTTFSLTIMAAPQVQWSYKLIDDETENPAIEITAVVPQGYHLYAPDSPSPGGTPLQSM